MVTSKISAGKIGEIVCPNQDCKRNLNHLDMTNLGLSKQMLEKYEEFSLNAAIMDMDDLGWCPLETCGAVANLERDQGFGRC